MMFEPSAHVVPNLFRSLARIALEYVSEFAIGPLWTVLDHSLSSSSIYLVGVRWPCTNTMKAA